MDIKNIRNFINKGNIVDKSIAIRYIVGISFLYLVFILTCLVVNSYVGLIILSIVFIPSLFINIYSVLRNPKVLSNYLLVAIISNCSIVFFVDFFAYVLLTDKISWIIFVLIAFTQILSVVVYILLIRFKINKKSVTSGALVAYGYSSMNLMLFLFAKSILKTSDRIIGELLTVVFLLLGSYYLIYEISKLSLKYILCKKHNITSFDI